MGSADRSIPREASLPYHPSPPIAPTGHVPAGRRAAHMAEQIIATQPASGAEALKALRTAFPDRPLAVRVAALGVLMRRQPDNGAP